MRKTLTNERNKIIPTYFQRALFRILNKNNISSLDLLKGVGIKESDFLKDDCRITFEQHKTFIKNALFSSNDPHLGWSLGKNVNISTLGTPGLALMASDTVDSAIEVFTRFIQLRAPSYTLELLSVVSPEKSIILKINESFDFGEIRYFMYSSFVSAFESVFNFLTQGRNLIEKVEFNFDEPNEWSKYSNSLVYSVSFGAQSTRIYLSKGVMEERLITADPDVKKSTVQVCSKILNEAKNESSIYKEVRQILIKHSGSYPSLNDMAFLLCISPRTLRRELEKSNTTYQKILDDVRLGVAKDLLINTTKNINSIGFEIGYKDASNFSRAFKTWSGMSPGKYRARFNKS